MGMSSVYKTLHNHYVRCHTVLVGFYDHQYSKLHRRAGQLLRLRRCVTDSQQSGVLAWEVCRRCAKGTCNAIIYHAVVACGLLVAAHKVRFLLEGSDVCITN